MSLKGTGEGSVGGRVEKLGLEKEGFAYHAYPVTFWDVFGEKGLPLRTTITEMGPLLLSRILNLNDTQSDILTIIFKIADDEGLLLIDTKDLRAMLQYVSENAKELSLTYGNIAKQSLTAIIRAVITLEEAGGEQFFGEPALSISDWIGTDCDGKGKIQILDCQKLMQSPKMYSTFLLWLMSELYETLPEAGDLPKPKMVFFFDEAHMLFDTANRALLEKIEQVVKLEPQRMAQFLRDDETMFADLLERKSNREIAEEKKRLEGELQKALMRTETVSRLYKKAFEKNTEGLLSDEGFLQITHEYDVEQLALKAKIPQLREQIAEAERQAANKDKFITAIRKFMQMDELTAPLLRELIDHIEVYETQGIGKSRTQRIAIHYRFVGYIDIPAAPLTSHYISETRQGVAVEYIPA